MEGVVEVYEGTIDMKGDQGKELRVQAKVNGPSALSSCTSLSGGQHFIKDPIRISGG